MGWIFGIFGLAIAALMFAAITDARFTKCTVGSVYSIVGLCNPAGKRP